MQKFSDGTVVVVCIRGGQELESRAWWKTYLYGATFCPTNCSWIHQNSMAVVVDYHRSGPLLHPVSIEGCWYGGRQQKISTMGFRWMTNWTWSDNTDMLFWNGSSISREGRGPVTSVENVLKMFYMSMVTSVLFFAVIFWGGSIKKTDTIVLDMQVRWAGSVVSMEMDSLMKVEKSRTYANCCLSWIMTVTHCMPPWWSRGVCSVAGCSKNCSTVLTIRFKSLYLLLLHNHFALLNYFLAT